MSDGGVSESRVYSIVRSEVAPLSRAVSQLDNNVGHLNNRMNRLEAEMANIENAIHAMANTLGSKLEGLQQATRKGLETNADHLRIANDRLLSVESTTRDGLEKNQRSTREGLALATAATLDVKSEVNFNTVSVERGTTAQIQMEFLRIHAEGQSAARRIIGFATEVDERFNKSLESVTLNRQLYDKHFASIHEEYDNKMHTIGEHIYRIIEEDFEPIVQKPLGVPKVEYQDLALAVDTERVEARSSQLDANLAEIRDQLLTPLIALHADFEANLKSRFGLDKATPVGEQILIPAAVVVDAEARIEVLADMTLRKKSNDAVRISLVKRDRLPAISNQLGAGGTAKTIAGKLTWRALEGNELDALSGAIRELQREGLLEEEYTGDLLTYLKACGLRVSVAGEIENRDLVTTNT
jgi:hypothetical protein